MLQRTQFEYLTEDSDEPVLVTIKPLDRVALHRELSDKKLMDEISIGEFTRRLVHTAAVRSGLVPVNVEYEEWFASLDDFAEVRPEAEAEEPGEASATPASS